MAMLKVGALVAALAMAPLTMPAELPLDALLKDPAAARVFDYWRLREGRPPEAIEPVRASVYAAMKLRNIEEPERCFSDAEIEIHVGLKGVQTAASARQWREDRDAAAGAVRRFDQAIAALMNGDSSGEATLDGFIRPYVARARAARTARGRELALRAARDQAIRRGFENEALLGPLTPSAHGQANWRLWNRVCRIDADNVAWIKREVRDHGWFEISRYGREAEKDAWMLAQHADDDIPFQTEVLARLDKLRARGETDPKSYAYLYDRVAINTGRPQRYGTQGGCRDGQRYTLPLEDPAKVDQLRAEVGMASLAEYNALFTCRR